MNEAWHSSFMQNYISPTFQKHTSIWRFRGNEIGADFFEELEFENFWVNEMNEAHIPKSLYIVDFVAICSQYLAKVIISLFN